MVKTAGSGQPVVTFTVQIDSALPHVKATQPTRAALLRGGACQPASEEALPRRALGRSGERPASSAGLREKPFGRVARSPLPSCGVTGTPTPLHAAGSRNADQPESARPWTGGSGAGTSLQSHS